MAQVADDVCAKGGLTGNTAEMTSAVYDSIQNLSQVSVNSPNFQMEEPKGQFQDDLAKMENQCKALFEKMVDAHRVDTGEVAWPKLIESKRDASVVLKPGESDVSYFDFFVSTEVKTVEVKVNASRELASEYSWQRTTLFDIQTPASAPTGK
jgi:hypothetical protein